MMLFDLLCFYCQQSPYSQHSRLQPNKRQMAGYCIYEMYLFSCISKALFEQVFSGTDTDKDADVHTQTQEHSLSVVKVLSYPERAAAKYDPCLAVNDWWCVFELVVYAIFFPPPQSLLFLGWQYLIISGPALICEVQQGEFEHLSHFKAGCVGKSKYRQSQTTKLVIK